MSHFEIENRRQPPAARSLAGRIRPTGLVARGSSSLLMRAAFALGLALGTVSVGASPVSAACDGIPPSFRKVASTAERIVIGDVIAVGSYPSRFTLRVRYVPRGDAPKIMEIRDLRPLAQCAAGYVYGHMSTRIAIAFDAISLQGYQYLPANTWALIRAPRSFKHPDRITVAEVFALAGTPLPETSTTPPAQPPPLPVTLMVSVIASALAAGAWLRRARTAAP